MNAEASLMALAGRGAGGDALSPALSRRERGSAASAMSLRALLDGFAQVTVEVTVTGLCLDSRQAQPGDAFFALPGELHDGREFITQAIDRGAVAVVHPHRHPRSLLSGGGEVPQIEIADLAQSVGHIAARFYGAPSSRMRVIGITGTNGKTTCAWLAAQALGGLGQKCALLTTVGGGFIGGDAAAAGAGDLQPAPLTTADAIATQRMLAEFHARGAAAVCVEASSHGLAQGRLGGVEFDLALLTNLSRDHLDYHRDMADYRAAKRRLFESPGLGCQVVNLDDDFGRALAGARPAAETFTYAVDDPAADLCARNIESSVDGIAFEADFRGEFAAVRAPLIGTVNAVNVLAAIALGLNCGYGLGELAAAARRWRAPPGRMELLPRAPGRPAVIIDYAHTPDALARALDSAAALCAGAGKLHLVFGCGGERDAGKRAAMGRVARRAARITVTDDNPRGESPAGIVADILSGMRAPDAATVIHDRARAIESAIADAAADDLVLIAGKGHETTQTVGACAREFSDRQVAAAVLEGGR